MTDTTSAPASPLSAKPKCDICGRTIRRDHSCLSSTRFQTGYRHHVCNDREFERTQP